MRPSTVLYWIWLLCPWGLTSWPRDRCLKRKIFLPWLEESFPRVGAGNVGGWARAGVHLITHGDRGCSLHTSKLHSLFSLQSTVSIYYIPRALERVSIFVWIIAIQPLSRSLCVSEPVSWNTKRTEAQPPPCRTSASSDSNCHATQASSLSLLQLNKLSSAGHGLQFSKLPFT